MKLLSHGLQAGQPWAKVELSLDDVERLVRFLTMAPGGNHVGDLRRQLQEVAGKLQMVQLPPPPPPPRPAPPQAAPRPNAQAPRRRRDRR